MTPQEILLAAAALIERTGWSRGEYAQGSDGDRCSPTAAHATRFCVLGAIRCVVDNGNVLGEVGNAALDRLGMSLDLIGDHSRLAQWNDKRRKASVVIAALRKAAQS